MGDILMMGLSGLILGMIIYMAGYQRGFKSMHDFAMRAIKDQEIDRR